MLTKSSVLAAFAFSHFMASIGLCSPIPSSKHGVTVVQSTPKSSPPGPMHFAKVHQKFKAEVPGDVVSALANSYVIASPGAYDSLYLVPVDVGGQTLNFDIDTGSADL